jgi:hypothetical protein
MSNSRQATFDRCPVCNTGFILKGNSYCSTLCRNLANRYRRRIDPLVKFLRSIGFVCDYGNYGESPLQYNFRLPLYMTYAYPVSCHVLHMPDPVTTPCEEIGIDELWEELQYDLGTPISGFLKFLFGHGSAYSAEMSTSLLEMFVATVKQDSSHSFLCGQCKNRFIESSLGKDHEFDFCSHCADQVGERYPF